MVGAAQFFYFVLVFRRVDCIDLSNATRTDTSLTPYFVRIHADLRLQKPVCFAKLPKAEWNRRGLDMGRIKEP